MDVCAAISAELGAQIINGDEEHVRLLRIGGAQSGRKPQKGGGDNRWEETESGHD